MPMDSLASRDKTWTHLFVPFDDCLPWYKRDWLPSGRSTLSSIDSSAPPLANISIHHRIPSHRFQFDPDPCLFTVHHKIHHKLLISLLTTSAGCSTFQPRSLAHDVQQSKAITSVVFPYFSNQSAFFLHTFRAYNFSALQVILRLSNERSQQHIKKTSLLELSMLLNIERSSCSPNHFHYNTCTISGTLELSCKLISRLNALCVTITLQHAHVQVNTIYWHTSWSIPDRRQCHGTVWEKGQDWLTNVIASAFQNWTRK